MWRLRNSEGYDQSHYAGKSLHRHENNTGSCFCQFIQKNGDFRAISVKERNRAAPPPIFKSVSSHIFGIGFSATFRRSVNRFSSKMSRGERGLGASDMKVYFQERGLGFSSPN